MPWDGAFPIGRGRGGRGPRAGLPGARSLAASRALRSAPAPGRGARRAGRGRGPRRGGPAGRAPAAGRVGARARGRVTECARASVYVCVYVWGGARAGRRGCVTAGGNARGAGTRVWPERTKGRPGWPGAKEGRGRCASRPPAARRDPAARGRARGAGSAHAPRPTSPASLAPCNPLASMETNTEGSEERGAPRGWRGPSGSPSPGAPWVGKAFGEGLSREAKAERPGLGGHLRPR